VEWVLSKGFAAALSRRTVAQQLALLVLIAALPLMLASWLMYSRLVINERFNIRQGLVTSARTLAALTDNEIDTYLAIGMTLSHSRTLQRGDLAAFELEARQALKFVPGAWLAVSTPDGQMVLNTLVEPGTALPKHVAPNIIEEAFSSRKPQVADLTFRPVAQRWMAFVEVPVFRDDALAYSLSIALSPDRFIALIADRFAANEVVAILDRNRKFVARIPDHESRVGTLASEGWRAAIDRSPEGWTENRTLEGDWSLTGYAPTAHGWTVGVARLERDLAAPLGTILWSSALLGGGLTVLALLFAFLFARRTSRDMAALAGAARDLGDGKLIAEPAAPFVEARTIARALVRTSAELQRRGDLIAQNQAELETRIADRTRELTAEIKRRNETEATLRQAQKMDSIGQLTGGIAHDFNNMLTVIMGNLDTLQRRVATLDNTASLVRPIESALQGARNAAKLTHRLLAFARQQPLEPTVIDLNALVANLSDMLVRTVGESVRIETVAAAGLWSALADASQVENALVNLAINARDAMPDGGRLTIETGNAFLDEAYVGRFGGLSPGQYVVLSVSDTGTGMEQEILERVFEPFFTTKELGRGTGLGLSMVHGFVSQSNGHIRIYSEVGHGTTVKIYLPRHVDSADIAANPRGEAAESKPMPLALDGESILLVEDDAAIRDYAVGVLEELGYDVLAVADADSALRALGGIARVDLLFTDIILGAGINGRQLADRVRELRPALAVLFTTGYTRNAIVHHGRLDAGVQLLNKPYTQRDLAEKIRQAIDTGRGQQRTA
jgi:signal transduction histidine kinase/CheY-like chemotaxis protein